MFIALLATWEEVDESFALEAADVDPENVEQSPYRPAHLVSRQWSARLLCEVGPSLRFQTPPGGRYPKDHIGEKATDEVGLGIALGLRLKPAGGRVTEFRQPAGLERELKDSSSGTPIKPLQCQLAVLAHWAQHLAYLRRECSSGRQRGRYRRTSGRIVVNEQHDPLVGVRLKRC
jgi:hypothetical protein